MLELLYGIRVQSDEGVVVVDCLVNKQPIRQLFTFNFSQKQTQNGKKIKELKHKSKSSKATEKYNETKIIL